MKNTLNFNSFLTEKYNLSTQLYHGTSIKFEEEIIKNGLKPRVGQLVKSTFKDDVENITENDNMKLIFLADEENLHCCVTAMIFSVSKVVEKHFFDVSLDDIKNNGILFTTEFNESIKHCPKNTPYPNKIYPISVHPGDYYTNNTVKVKNILKENNLMDFFNERNKLHWIGKINKDKWLEGKKRIGINENLKYFYEYHELNDLLESFNYFTKALK